MVSDNQRHISWLNKPSGVSGCQSRSRQRRWPEGPGFTARDAGRTIEPVMRSVLERPDVRGGSDCRDNHDFDCRATELERERDAVVETEASDKASKMIQQLTGLRGIGVQSATVLVREAFVRRFANGKALGSYAGLASSPYSSGGIDREQGIGKAGNRRVRTVMVELVWLWTRYQPAAAQVCWFRERVGSTGRRVRKIMVVALARKLLIALWRFVVDGVLPEGAVFKPAA